MPSSGTWIAASARGVRLDLAQLLGREQAQAAKTVFLAALEQRMQARDFLRAGGHHHLAANLVRDRMSLAELDHLPHALDGQAGAPRAGLVIQSAMQHAAVVTALMPRHGVFLFEHGDGRSGQPLQ